MLDQVISLPNAPKSLSKMFSGYLNISDTKHIHYIYVESKNNPASDPLVFWTNGGPGMSSTHFTSYIINLLYIINFHRMFWSCWILY
jgi:hypothetical protein